MHNSYHLRAAFYSSIISFFSSQTCRSRILIVT